MSVAGLCLCFLFSFVFVCFFCFTQFPLRTLTLTIKKIKAAHEFALIVTLSSYSFRSPLSSFGGQATVLGEKDVVAGEGLNDDAEITSKMGFDRSVSVVHSFVDPLDDIQDF